MKVLYLLDEWPIPTTSGSKVHDKIMMGCLTTEWAADVAVWSDGSEPAMDSAPSADRILPRTRLSWRSVVPAAIKLWGNNTPLHSAEFLSSLAKAKLRNLVEATTPDAIILSCTRLAVIVPFLRSLTSAKLVVDTHDVHVQRCKSIYETLRPFDVKERVKQRLLMHSYGIIEKTIYKNVDVAWALKEEDKALLQSFESVPVVDIVPNVVDPAMVRDVAATICSNQHREVTCVFIGDYSYQPNEQCALTLMDWFSEDQVRNSGVTLYLIGVKATTAMLGKSNGKPNVHVTGPVAELTDYYHPVDTIFLAPLTAGGGVKRKVIEAMACGCPVISTPVGAEGLDVVHGEMAEICSIADFPAAIRWLAHDRDARRKYAERGLQHISRHFGYRRLQQSVRSSLEAMIGTAPC